LTQPNASIENRALTTIENQQRRTLLKGGLAALASVPLMGLVEAASADRQLAQVPRYGLAVDANRCVEGCSACVDACNEEHGLHGFDAPLTDAQWIRKVTLRNRSTERIVSMPVMCQHCDDPPCVDVCPTGASFKRFDGLVLVDKHICIGCRYCMMACPFEARSFIHETLTDQLPAAPRGKGTVESCTLCVHRIDEGKGRQPACVEACAGAGHHALTFGDRNKAESPIATLLREQASRELRPDLELGTGVRYLGL
jgi:tetrathionate reductase subunit B